MKTRYFIFLAYDGSSYHGWQVQTGKITVQARLEDALSLILREDIKTVGAGRTDTGVHARFFVAHFDTVTGSPDREDNVIFRLNSYLPEDICIMSIRKVRGDAHARFDAISRTYRYYISMKKDPFSNRYSWHRYGEMDIDAMNRAAAILPEHTDFTSFSKLHTQVKTNDCRIYQALWHVHEDMLIFTVKADRFLRNMVRALTGTMVDIGTGKIPPGEIEKILRARDRSSAGVSAPARGLFLENIEYDEDVFI